MIGQPTVKCIAGQTDRQILFVFLLLKKYFFTIFFSAKETSTEELIAAYHAACVQNKVKANPKILQQLQVRY